MSSVTDRVLICDNHSQRALEFAQAIRNLDLEADIVDHQAGLDDLDQSKGADPCLILIACDLFNPNWQRAHKILRRIYPYSRILTVDDSDSPDSDLSHPRQLRRFLRPDEEAGMTQVPIGDSPVMQNIRASVRRLAQSDATVLVTGETGSGKEVVARFIHHMSPRSHQPFVAVNCAAIPDELLESELFGHEKGAFTGANQLHRGRFERANGGTLFLDEIGDMPASMQVKLLRALQERTIERVGSVSEIPIDIRVIAATHRDLHVATRSGDFREDLYYRLSVFPLHMPALRDRPQDIPLLVDHLIEQMRLRREAVVCISEMAMQRLMEYDWPGNVRELANLLEWLTVMHPDRAIHEHHLSDWLHQNLSEEQLQVRERLPNEWLQGSGTEESGFPLLPESGLDLSGYLRDREIALIRQALRLGDGVVARAADLLQLRRTTLVEKMRKYDIKREECTDEFLTSDRQHSDVG